MLPIRFLPLFIAAQQSASQRLLARDGSAISLHQKGNG
jgi:hypothetical protein